MFSCFTLEVLQHNWLPDHHRPQTAVRLSTGESLGWAESQYMMCASDSMTTSVSKTFGICLCCVCEWIAHRFAANSCALTVLNHLCSAQSLAQLSLSRRMFSWKRDVRIASIGLCSRSASDLWLCQCSDTALTLLWFWPNVCQHYHHIIVYWPHYTALRHWTQG